MLTNNNTNTNTIKIGKNHYTTEQFITAVKTSGRFTEVADRLGLNKQVSSHISGIKTYVEQLHIDTSHFKYIYNMSEEAKVRTTESKIKQFHLTAENQKYFEAYEESFGDNKSSWATYKASVGNFMEQINKDITQATITEAEDFIQGKDNRRAHIKSFLTYIIKNNINDCQDKMTKDALLVTILL
jgi:hypothetical protein